MSSKSYEVNFDSIVGPTHNYSGLSYGNIASMEHQNTPSNPKKAALQGLEKMKFLHDLGIKQAVLPPHERPHLPTLRELGFTGPDRLIPEKVYKAEPIYLFHTSSASAMWAANAATFCPSIDSSDKMVHITTANLASTIHRAIEPGFTQMVLKKIFSNTVFFQHHAPLPMSKIHNDEGSANHTRFCKDYKGMGLHLFVYGMRSLSEWAPRPQNFPARQTLEASEAVVRNHKIFPERVIFAQQSPVAIDAGVFHNDVISVGDRNLFFYHESAFLDGKAVIEEIQDKARKILDTEMHFIKVPAQKISLKTAVKTYLFNSQLITLADGAFALVAPEECRTDPYVYDYLEKLIKDPDNPIRDIHYIDIRESMQNGGGPACLRTRVPLTEDEILAVNQRCLFSDHLYARLRDWVDAHYRDRLTPKDLKDPTLIDETQKALDELSVLLDLGHIYSFQR